MQDPVFPIDSLYQEAYTSLIGTAIRVNRRSKKKHNLTVAKTKGILQKINHDEKAESYILEDGTR